MSYLFAFSYCLWGWTWVWLNSGSWWWTGRPGVFQLMGSQRVGPDWATKLNWTELGKNTEVVCHSLLQWTTLCQNSPPWPVHLGWPYTAWLIVSLSLTRLGSMWSDWLVFCDCSFQSICSLIEKDNRLMEASWWEIGAEGETGSCSDGQGHAQ